MMVGSGSPAIAGMGNGRDQQPTEQVAFAFGVVRSTTPEKGLERHPKQAWAVFRYLTATRGGSMPP